MKKYLFALFTALALVLAVAFALALVKAASNQSPTQNLTPKVEEVKINGEAVEPIITSVSEVESSTTTTLALAPSAIFNAVAYSFLVSNNLHKTL